MKKAIAAAIFAAAVLASSAASAQVCVLGIFILGGVVAANEHRELTQDEAMSCGLTTLFEKPKEEPKKKVHHAKKVKPAN